ncbi:hypothetical protein BC937DRAFT_91242 [Endogone sp. FLAS-F59071]|nr:hypothetical protein BC937DRAFT_91242 [Endogone sp. FLAS-F59071]|eukprot:RUS21865.1 hypothetical protein BC937DRAFT_91242 [Endogone sp. FLAS-F59071]
MTSSRSCRRLRLRQRQTRLEETFFPPPDDLLPQPRHELHQRPSFHQRLPAASLSHHPNKAGNCFLSALSIHASVIHSRLRVIQFVGGTQIYRCMVRAVPNDQAFLRAAVRKVPTRSILKVLPETNLSSPYLFQKFFKGGNKIAEFKGVNPSELEALIKQHQGPVSEDSAAGVYGVIGHSDLTELVTLSQLECLNQKEAHNARNIFAKGSAYLESDVDEQLIIIVPFNQSIRQATFAQDCRSAKWKPSIINTTHFPAGHAPKTIKLYMNRLSLGFDEAESVEETQLIELEEKDLAENAVVPLRFVKWQYVTSVVVG